MKRRYTAGYQWTGATNFVKALTRPTIGTWETPDYQPEATFAPSDGRTYSPDGLPITTGCTGYDG